MAQEFTIKSEAIESKINQLLPSQGGFGAGVDFSASTMVVPIIDLTESAEGSGLRQDLQSSLSLTSVTSYNISNTTSTIINTTGYFRLSGIAQIDGAGSCQLQLTNGFTTKIIRKFNSISNLDSTSTYDLILFLQASESLQGVSTAGTAVLNGVTRQIATITGDLVNP